MIGRMFNRTSERCREVPGEVAVCKITSPGIEGVACARFSNGKCLVRSEECRGGATMSLGQLATLEAEAVKARERQGL